MSDETPRGGPDEREPSGAGERGAEVSGAGGGAAGLWARVPGGPRRKAYVAGAGALAVLLAAVIGVATSGNGDVIDGEMAAARVASPVPLGPLVVDLPYDCGLSPATIDRLTGGPDREHSMTEDSEECTWEIGPVAYAGTGGPNRELKVDVHKGTDRPRSDASAEFIRVLDSDTRPVGIEPGPVRRLAGIGDEAVIWDQVDLNGALYPDETKPRNVTSRTNRTTILFRAGNVVAKVSYAGSDYRPKDDGKVIPDMKEKLLSVQTTQGAALYAARDVLQHLGGRTDGTPHVIEAPKRRPAPAPKACALVTPPTLKRLGDTGPAGVTGDQEESYLIEGERDDLTADACSWEGGGSLMLQTEIISARDSRVGTGDQVIGREYDRMYFYERESPVEDDGEEPGERIVGALKGLGDRAFFAYGRGTSRDGTIYLQRGNTLVRVRCWSIDEPTKNTVLDCAYRAAQEASRHVQG